MRMQARWNGAVLAESEETVVVEGNHYFPRESLSEEHFTPSGHRSLCFWKGVASYHSVSVDGLVNPDAAWAYERPSILARKIKGRVAFGSDVSVHSVEANDESGLGA